MLRIIYLALFFFVFVSCASSKGLRRDSVSKQVGVEDPVVTDDEIKQALARKPNLPKPFKLAVYFKAPQQFEHYGKVKWRWNTEDKKLIEELAEKTDSNQIISEAFPLLNTLVKKNDLKSIRLVAAKHGADAVLIIEGITNIDRYTNSLGWTYALLAPLLFIPGSRVDALFVVNASMWDVRNEYLYFTAESEALYGENYIAAFGKKDEEIYAEVKQLAMNDLKKQMVKQLQSTTKK